IRHDFYCIMFKDIVSLLYLSGNIMKYSSIYLALFLLLSFSSCNKNNSTTANANFQFTILNESGQPADKTVITLYKTENDYYYDQNAVASQTTDNNGIAIFSNLSPVSYYYYIFRSDDCASNYFTTNHTSNALIAGQTNYLSVLINERGHITLNNF